MAKILIADSAEELSDALKQHLTGAHQIVVCDNGEAVLELLRTFKPDVLVIDIMLRDLAGWSVLQMLAGLGRTKDVIVTTRCREEYIFNRLSQLGFANVFIKPSRFEVVASAINDLCFRISNPNVVPWCVENEINNILMCLSFRIGTSGYRYAHKAIVERYYNPYSAITKIIYPSVAAECGGTAKSVEKSLRDAISHAVMDGNKNIWMFYFLPDADGNLDYPSNDVFISTIAELLRQRARIEPPYDLRSQKEA